MFGGGGFFNWFNKASSSATKMKGEMKAGFDKKEFSQFMQQSRSLGSATKRVDADKEGFGPQWKAKRVRPDQTNPLTEDVSKEQMESFVKAFRKRQDEVFSRRAQPGVISQTRIV